MYVELVVSRWLILPAVALALAVPAGAEAEDVPQPPFDQLPMLTDLDAGMNQSVALIFDDLGVYYGKKWGTPCDFF